jgi:GNAT superfamily N-acetyltransferase
MVIQQNGKTVGNMCVAPPQDNDVDDSVYELHGIYLHPDYYRQGIGSQAMEFAYNIARNLGKTVMTVWVFEDNTNSVRFYEKCGFTADGKTKILNCGKPLTAIRMRRDL